jgi:hypothetical protein
VPRALARLSTDEGYLPCYILSGAHKWARDTGKLGCRKEEEVQGGNEL